MYPCLPATSLQVTAGPHSAVVPEQLLLLSGAVGCLCSLYLIIYVRRTLPLSGPVGSQWWTPWAARRNSHHGEQLGLFCFILSTSNRFRSLAAHSSNPLQLLNCVCRQVNNVG